MANQVPRSDIERSSDYVTTIYPRRTTVTTDMSTITDNNTCNKATITDNHTCDKSTITEEDTRVHYAWKISSIVLVAVCAGLIFRPFCDSCPEIRKDLKECQVELEATIKIVVDLKISVGELKAAHSKINIELHETTALTKVLEDTKTDLEKRNAAMQRVNKELQRKYTDIQQRLSELLLANPNIDETKFDKGEEYSRIKISEEFRKLYLYEYTDATIEMEQRPRKLDTAETVKYLLNILQLAYDLCQKYSTQHLTSVKESIMSIPVQVPADHENRTDLKKVVSLTEDQLSAIEWKNILELRIAVAVRLEKSLIKTLVDVITQNFDIENDKEPKVVQYIYKCLRVCWKMFMHPKPVFAYFEKSSGNALFNADVYTSYLTAGKYVDYIVWPPLYSYDGGEMLAQGTAKGKN